ncbi:MAG: cytochrome c biogenesis protein CcdA [Alphaproteobacteria bacterium]|nr:cytochrome c biogenesis protein CcdA [Alphaproteobacteria bacterium]
MDVTLAGAFIGGALSFISPCLLPLIPPYLCYIAGVTHDELRGSAGVAQGRIVAYALAFVIGFSIIFIGFGAIATVFGQFITENFDLMNYGAGALIILFGLHFLGVIRIPILHRQARFESRAVGGPLGAFVLGLAFAFGWTPCVGPILAAILFMAGSEDSVWEGVVLLTSYSAGIGLPFVLAAAFTGAFLTISDRLKRNMAVIERVSGGFLIVTGLLFMTGLITEIGFFIQRFVPSLGTIG